MVMGSSTSLWFVGGELIYIIMADNDFTTIHYVSISRL